jgi:DNA-binding GntR family transcriptional regulator
MAIEAVSAGPARHLGASGTTPGPLARPSSGAQVAGWIRGRILAGTLRRGDRVVQEEVARELGVSRIPVREALVALDLEGWITLEPHRGAFVRGVDDAWVRDHYEVLGVLYGLAAQFGAIRATPAERAQLDALQREHVVATDIHEFDACNHALLAQVLTMARSPRVGTSLRAAGSVVPGNFFAAVPDTVDPQRRGIAATVDAIRGSDASGARGALESLIARQGDAVVALLAERGVVAAEA